MGRMQWATIGLCLVGGCGLAGGNNDLRPVEVGLASSVTIGQAAQIALSAMDSSGEVRCATVVTRCTEYPCDGEVLITYGSGCPMPLGGEAVGSTTVTGTWSSENVASLDLTFTDVEIDGRGTVVASATTIEASQADGVTTLEFTGANAQTQGLGSIAGATTIDVTVNDSGTPDDPSDDSFTVDTTVAGAGAGTANTLRIDEVLISPDCRLNPVAGEASIVEAGITNVRTDELTFHSSCDGTAELETTLGGPNTVELDFLVQD